MTPDLIAGPAPDVPWLALCIMAIAFPSCAVGVLVALWVTRRGGREVAEFPKLRGN